MARRATFPGPFRRRFQLQRPFQGPSQRPFQAPSQGSPQGPLQGPLPRALPRALPRSLPQPLTGALAGDDVPTARDVLRPLHAVTAVTALAAVATGLAAPPDAVQGQWMRLMYLHVPAAWLGYLAFTVVACAGVAHLRTRSRASDRWAQAAAEVGVCATALTLVTGSVWGRAVWGVWWAWDARLVSTAAMLLLYTAVLAVRALDPTAPRQRRRAAVAGVACFAVVPVVHFSVLWWSTLHQRPTIMTAPGQAHPIDPRMALALSLAVVAASALGVVAMVLRVERLARGASGADQVARGLSRTSAEGAR